MMSNLLKCCILWICFQTYSPAVDCQELRLTAGFSPNSGRLEIYLRGKWGTVQAYHQRYEASIARVACRELGYRGHHEVLEPVRAVYSTRATVWMRQVRCTGSEETLHSCQHAASSSHYYRHGRDIAILCLNFPKEDIPLRLADGPSPNKGRLEIMFNEDWLTVCISSFAPSVAEVACRHMGYRGVAKILASMKQTSRTIGVTLGSTGYCRGSQSTLLDCFRGRIAIGTSYCPKQIFNIVCTNQSADSVPIRLVDGQTPNSGKLEIKLDGSWGGVCQKKFDIRDAKVACQSLGYSGIATKLDTSSVVSNFWLYGLLCTGSESHLLDCPYSEYDCGLSDGVHLVCTNQTTDSFPIRLSDTITLHSGRLEVQIGGVWGTVCSKNFDITDANIACRDLGYSAADGTGGVMNEDVDLRSIPIWINYVECKGHETNLSTCSYSQQGLTECRHDDDVAVRCRHSSEDTFPLRLVDGNSVDNGRLEIQVDGVWGTVCNHTFGQTEGTVACHNLGYWKFHRFVELPPTDRRNVAVWLDNVECSGSELTLIECAHSGVGIHNCTHQLDVAIKCLHRDAVSARLHHGVTANMGRLELRVDGIWGTVCNHQFDYKDARVACRMLGYTDAYGIMGRMDGVRSDSVLSIWLDKVSCTGSESHLLDCPHGGIGVHSCSHSDDVGLKCLTQDPVSARLKDGLTANSGRLELEIDGVWGAVCREGFGQRDAAVACRMLGYNGTALALASTTPSRGPRSPLWMYGLRCNGTESSLLDCPHEIRYPLDRQLQETCSRKDDISIMCLTTQVTQSVSARLVDGRFEIQLDGVWGTIGRNSYTVPVATVACKMLGFTGRSSLWYVPPQPTPRDTPQWLDGLECKGNETSLLDCDHTVMKRDPSNSHSIKFRCYGPVREV